MPLVAQQFQLQRCTSELHSVEITSKGLEEKLLCRFMLITSCANYRTHCEEVMTALSLVLAGSSHTTFQALLQPLLLPSLRIILPHQGIQGKCVCLHLPRDLSIPIDTITQKRLTMIERKSCDLHLS